MELIDMVEISAKIHKCALKSHVSRSFDDIYPGECCKNIKIIIILLRSQEIKTNPYTQKCGGFFTYKYKALVKVVLCKSTHSQPYLTIGIYL